MIRMAVFDIDGTLVQYPEYSVPASTIEGIKRLKENGIKIVIATARGGCEVEEWLTDQINPDYIIISNGQAILDESRNPIYASYLDNQIIDRFAKYASDCGFNTLMKFLDCSCVYSGGFPDEPRFFHGARWFKDETMKYHYQQGCTGMLVVWKEDNPNINPNLPDLFPELAFFSLSKNIGYDVVAKGNNKLKGLERLLEVTGYTLDECIGFGDSSNDNEILKAQGLSVCLGNGSQVTKDIVDYVTDDIHQDGIYKALVHFQLIKEDK